MLGLGDIRSPVGASGLMKATATGCTVGSPIELNPDYAVLRLNLYGIERKVSQIVVTNTTSTASPKPSYTLSISPAITVSSDMNTPTPFFIVVPAGESAWKFKTEVTSEPVTQCLLLRSNNVLCRRRNTYRV